MAETYEAPGPDQDGPRPFHFLRRLVVIVLALVVVGFVLMFATVLISTQIYAARGADAIERRTADVIIVLSAGVDREGAELDEFTQARIDLALELYARGAAPYILMSGGRYSEDAGGNIAELMKSYAIERVQDPDFLPNIRRISPQVIFIEGNSISTFENARYTYRVICEDHSDLEADVWCADSERSRRRRATRIWRTAILVTDDYHMLRASTLFDYWRQNGDIEIVAYAPANGRERVTFMRATGALLRESLAIPFNVLKMGGQFAVETLGLEEDVEIR